MTNELNPAKVIQLLIKSTQSLDGATLSALASARQNTLKKHSVRVPGLKVASASEHSSVHWIDRMIPHAAIPWVAAGLLVAILLGGTGYWQHVQEQQIDETDVAILTGDLPIEVYVN
ncbi:MAG: DUF3619 family protein [Gallionella sp.]